MSFTQNHPSGAFLDAVFRQLRRGRVNGKDRAPGRGCWGHGDTGDIVGDTGLLAPSPLQGGTWSIRGALEKDKLQA